MTDLRALTARHATSGRIEAIVLRPQRDAAAQSVGETLAVVGRGLAGDRRALRQAGDSAAATQRELTLIQAEHLPLVAHWLGRDAVDPLLLRRNLVVAGLNLLAMRSPFADQRLVWRIGDAVRIEVTGPCAPCSKMERSARPRRLQRAARPRRHDGTVAAGRHDPRRRPGGGRPMTGRGFADVSRASRTSSWWRGWDSNPRYGEP